jgi:hypothetical protein
MPETEPANQQLNQPNEQAKSPHNKETRGDCDTPKKKFCDSHRLRCIEVIFAGVLVVVGIAYTVFAALQWQAMRDQLTQMKRSTDIAASNYKLQANALHIDQRAWVADEFISGKAELGKPYIVKISIKNTGKTFAKNFVGRSVFKTKQLSDPDPNFDRDVLNMASSTDSIGLIAPNGVFDAEITVNEVQKITEDNIRAFSDPTIVYLVFGKITYEDIFKCEHWTTFCCRAFPVNGEYVTYTTYNDADDNMCP